MSAEIGAGDSAGQFETLHAEAKAALAYAANTLRSVAGTYREAFHADLAGWHEDRDALDQAGGANGTAAELERRVALGTSELGERQAELARLELAVRGLERTWLFLERGDASLLADPAAPELSDELQMRIVEAREAERTRLAQEIHDGPAQALSNAIFGVEYIEKILDHDPSAARVELRFLRERLRRELGDVRAFISQLRPPILDEVGLDGAIRDAAATLHALSGAAVEVDLAASPDDLGDAEQVVVLRVLQEALQNVRKHAGARHVRDRHPARRWPLDPGGPRRRPRLRSRRSGRPRAAHLRTPVHARAGRARSRRVHGPLATRERHRRGPRRSRSRERRQRMTYPGPERRRGGPDRRGEGERIRILLVDDHALVRVGMRAILEREPDFEIVGEADDGRSAHDVALQTSPDIILMDLSLPAPGGIEITQKIKRDLPATGIIILASDEDEEALFQAIRAGAAAFILKDVGPDDLVTIVRRVSTGEFLINDKVFAKPAVASRVLKEFRELAIYGQEAAPIFAPLSPREVEILDNIAQGMTNKQVAYQLSISEQTVKNHMSSILRKLAVNDRTQAVVYAMRQGWIRMPED